MESLVLLDIFRAKKTKKAPKAVKERHIAGYIPDGCTGHVQSIDTILNKLVQDQRLLIFGRNF